MPGKNNSNNNKEQHDKAKSLTGDLITRAVRFPTVEARIDAIEEIRSHIIDEILQHSRGGEAKGMLPWCSALETTGRALEQEYKLRSLINDERMRHHGLTVSFEYGLPAEKQPQANA